MKTFISVFVSVFFFQMASAQEKRIDEKRIPVEVISYLKQSYPNAKEKEYYQKKEKDTLYYEVEFELNRQSYNLKFSLIGTLLETEREVELADLPPAQRQTITATLHENFQKLKIEKIQEVDPLGKKQFEVNVKAKKSKKYKPGFYKLMFDAQGRLLSIEEEKLYSLESVF